MNSHELIEKFIDLPKKVAYDLVSRKGWTLPPGIDIEDLSQAGYLGLIDAANKYVEGKGPWEGYARIRIKGAMIDWMRSVSWSTRTDR